jgi:hypothetical protein
MAREADVAYFGRLFRIEHGFHRAALGEDPVWVFQANDFMELHQVNVIGLETLQRFVDLLCRRGFCAAVNLGHQEYFVAVTACQRLTHPHFADAVVVIPAVIHEGDAMIDGAADELNGFLLLKRRLTDVICDRNSSFALAILLKSGGIRPNQGRKGDFR